MEVSNLNLNLVFSNVSCTPSTPDGSFNYKTSRQQASPIQVTREEKWVYNLGNGGDFRNFYTLFWTCIKPNK